MIPLNEELRLVNLEVRVERIEERLEHIFNILNSNKKIKKEEE